MRTEQACQPHEKFLQAAMLLSDRTVNALQAQSRKQCKEKDAPYHAFINWQRKANEVAVFTLYAYAELAIPKKFDCIFLYENPEIHVPSAFEITQSIWEGWMPLSYIDDGHKHLCILQFENEVPDILTHLHYETQKQFSGNWKETKMLGFCNIENLQSIIEKHQDL